LIRRVQAIDLVGAFEVGVVIQYAGFIGVGAHYGAVTLSAAGVGSVTSAALALEVMDVDDLNLRGGS
jgi:hypothetical protein